MRPALPLPASLDSAVQRTAAALPRAWHVTIIIGGLCSSRADRFRDQVGPWFNSFDNRSTSQVGGHAASSGAKSNQSQARKTCYGTFLEVLLAAQTREDGDTRWRLEMDGMKHALQAMRTCSHDPGPIIEALTVLASHEHARLISDATRHDGASRHQLADAGFAQVGSGEASQDLRNHQDRRSQQQ